MSVEIDSDEKNRFQEHLKSDKNSRILFSGIFGVGKTTFLKNYFEENKNYNVIHLFPVNYQVSKNEDVFEYIKYDLLNSLIKNNWLNLKNKKGEKYKNLILSYLESRGKESFLKFVFGLPVLKHFSPIIEDFNKFKEGKMTAFDSIKEFQNGLNNEKGSIYENDVISNLISEVLRNNRGDRENVLIIDDLDRIDPDHIFRILNVFSAHFDVDNDNNKFGFDKIIIVCDLENIKNIFHSKFGSSTDFNGYIDKFYTGKVFYFYNASKLISDIENLFKESYGLFKKASESFFKLLVSKKLFSYREYQRLVKQIENTYHLDGGIPIELRDEDKKEAVRFCLLLKDIFGNFSFFKNKIQTLTDDDLLFADSEDKLFLVSMIYLYWKGNSKPSYGYYYLFGDGTKYKLDRNSEFNCDILSKTEEDSVINDTLNLAESFLEIFENMNARNIL